MENKIDAEVKTNTPSVPIKWVFAMLSASGSAIIIAVYIGIWAGKVEAKANEVPDVIKELKQMNERLSRIEGIAQVFLKGKK